MLQLEKSVVSKRTEYLEVTEILATNNVAS